MILSSVTIVIEIWLRIRRILWTWGWRQYVPPKRQQNLPNYRTLHHIIWYSLVIPLLKLCFLGLLFYPEDGGSTFLRNVRCWKMVYSHRCFASDSCCLPRLDPAGHVHKRKSSEFRRHRTDTCRHGLALWVMSLFTPSEEGGFLSPGSKPHAEENMAVVLSTGNWFSKCRD
jgi:hypothetical protein